MGATLSSQRGNETTKDTGPAVLDEYFQFDVTTAVPASVDLRRSVCFPYTPPKDQGPEGKCVSYAVAGAVECAQRRKRIPLTQAWNPDVDSHFESAIANEPAAKSRSRSDGITFAEAVRAYGDSSSSEVQFFRLVPTLANLKHSLYSGYPFVFGFAVSKKARQWQESEELQRSTKFALPATYALDKSDIDGYHSALAVGYDDARSAFLVRNSWGDDWGDSGHFWFPYAAMIDEDIVSDVMIVDLGSARSE